MSQTELVQALWIQLEKAIGEDLRAVVRYESTSFEMRMRDDVRPQYNCDESRRFVDDAIVDQLSLPHTQDVFKTGQLRGQIRMFDDAWILFWPDRLPGKSGFMVSVQRDADCTSLDDVETCLDVLRDEILPRLEGD